MSEMGKTRCQISHVKSWKAKMSDDKGHVFEVYMSDIKSEILEEDYGICQVSEF